ncbi:MAG: DeoR/GlpR family DNA-binding transcription regulator [Spirochaeta sp.]|jgi:DeoR/GlpR family transcriptional regulator of sugar metabolism|nr:DeoR/GlpR family DNA-binding transcription regulator [Spirochaeta sp.]
MNDRQKAILRILGEDRELSVSQLSDRFQVSGVTIRQDLDHLQGQGLLRRVHGGAVLHSEEDIAHRLGVNFESKLAIAERAGGYIERGDTIFIEAGSANAILARQLAHRQDIRVVTNNIFIARTLKDSDVTVVTLGGVYQHESECVVGRLARLGILEVNFTKAFIGVDGFTFEHGLTCSDMMRAEIAGAVVAGAQETFVLTDSTKFGRTALSRICKIDEVEHIITDGDLPEEYYSGLIARGVHVDI